MRRQNPTFPRAPVFSPSLARLLFEHHIVSKTPNPKVRVRRKPLSSPVFQCLRVTGSEDQ